MPRSVLEYSRDLAVAASVLSSTAAIPPCQNSAATAPRCLCRVGRRLGNWGPLPEIGSLHLIFLAWISCPSQR